MIGIYGIHNKVNDKWYVGQSNNIRKRNLYELRNLRNGVFHYNNSNNHIVQAWQKYGENAFEWVVLEECEIDKLDEREIFWIREKDSYRNGYNQTLGGGGSRGVIVSEETKRKMSLSSKGEKHPFWGKHRTEETKKKLSLWRTGRKGMPMTEKVKKILIESRRIKIICNENGKIYSSMSEASRELNLDVSAIAKNCKGKRSTVKGYTFKLVKEN